MRGLSLIEVLILLAILVILVVMTLPAILRAL